MQLAELNFIQVPPWAWAGLITLTTTILCLLLKRIVLARIQRWVHNSSFFVDSLFIKAIGLPLTLIVLLLNLVLLQQLLASFGVTSNEFGVISRSAIAVLMVLAVVIFVDRLVSGMISRYLQKSETWRSSHSIVNGITRAFILSIGALVLLSTLGISITPIIASLGIGSLAVALALQPTLENFFSGVQLVMDKPIRVGDFIELESGEQGFVERIGWRSTWINMLPNNTVIMPNGALSKSKIINYYYPSKELSVPVEVGVHYSSDLDHVEQVTLEVAREILNEHPWGVGSYDTFVLFHTFDSSSINFTVMLRTEEYFHRFFVRSAFLKALHKRYGEEGIVIPYPITAINTAQESPRFEMGTKE